MIQKIGVVGIGPVGLILAVQIREAGFDVAVCDIDEDKINSIRQQEVKLEGVIQKSVIFSNAFTSINALLEYGPDLLIVATKAHHTSSLLDQIAEVKNKELCVMSAQNGIDSELQFTSKFDKSRILRMVVNYAGAMSSPNVVNVTFFNPPNYIASIEGGCNETAKWISDVLTGQNMETQYVESDAILTKIWEKGILNASLSPLCAVSKLTMKEAMTNDDTLELIKQIIIEGIEVAKAEGVILKDDFLEMGLGYLNKAGDHFPSLAVDFMNGRETEIDYFNGKIVEYGKRHHTPTPLNLTFTNLMKAVTSVNKQKADKKAQSINT